MRRKKPQLIKCKKCAGTGEHASLNENHKCFSCQGKGFMTPADRLRQVRYEILQARKA